MKIPKPEDAAQRVELKKITRLDLVIIVLILLLSSAIILWSQAGIRWQVPGSAKAVVYHEGDLIQGPALAKDQELILLDGKMTVEIKDNRIRVKQSDCPRHLCVDAGWIKNHGETIICVPYKILIKIESTRKLDVDAVAY